MGGDLGVQTGVTVAANDVTSVVYDNPDQGLFDTVLNGTDLNRTDILRDGSERRHEVVSLVGPELPVGPSVGPKVLKGYKYAKTIGNKYDVFEKTVKSKKLGGQARAVYTKIKNQAGKTIRYFKDAFKRDGRHYERANKYPYKSRSRKRD